MQLPEDPDSRSQINIVPMIDVIFVVLAFFILSSLFLTRNTGLPVNLPEATSSEETTQQHTITVTLLANGDLFVGTQPIALDRLTEAVQLRRIGDRPFLVIVQADEQVPHGRVVAVMDRLRTLQNISLGLATEPPQPLPSSAPAQ
ncbi:MAG: biopolymer transporter ExbD [Leptolyngbyaceae cyanobacterium T60_A2020_046]|nr:biopolymer transporter ExbD [Leptolyngbyaceae cyanobacterium T60_A2020_046]